MRVGAAHTYSCGAPDGEAEGLAEAEGLGDGEAVCLSSVPDGLGVGELDDEGVSVLLFCVEVLFCVGLGVGFAVGLGVGLFVDVNELPPPSVPANVKSSINASFSAICSSSSFICFLNSSVSSSVTLKVS